MKYPKLLSILFAVAICLASITLVCSQEAAMTNDEVVSLHKAGMSNTFIIGKIRSSKVNFDTSTTAILALNKEGISEDIITAMLETKDTRPGYSDSQPTSSVPPSATTPIKEDDKTMSQMPEPGIYLSENGKYTALEPTVYSGSKSNFLGTALTYGIKKTKIRAVIRGRSANMQAKSARPEFYFLFSRRYENTGAVMTGIAGYGATSPNEFMLVSMKLKDNSRETTLGEFSGYTTSTGASDKDVREFTVEKIKPGLYKVTPKVDLPVGEYCFYFAGSGGQGGKVFDFGVGH